MSKLMPLNDPGVTSFVTPDDNPLATPRGIAFGLKLALGFWLTTGAAVLAWFLL